jgi:sporulation protein YqfC
VRISTGCGELVISGENFVLQAISQEEIAVEGKIGDLRFNN